MSQLKRITKRFVLLCEGQHDSEFFTHLIAARSIPNNFEICSANYVLGISQGGNTRFCEALDELVSVPGFATVEKILIVADNDLNPVASFDYVVRQINSTADILSPYVHRFIAPAAPQTKAGISPAIVILMLPWTGVIGSFDNMCVSAAANGNPAISACVDAFASCSQADTWPSSPLAKMKLRSFIAASWRDAPGLSPSYVWSKNTNIVPLTDSIFDDVATFLQGFPAL